MNSNGMAIEIPFSRGAQLDSRVDGGLVCPSNAAYLEPDRRVGESIYFRSFILYYLGGDDIVPFPCYQPNGVLTIPSTAAATGMHGYTAAFCQKACNFADDVNNIYEYIGNRKKRYMIY